MGNLVDIIIGFIIEVRLKNIKKKHLEVDVYVVKIIGMILLAVFLIAKGLEGFLGLHLAAVPEFIISVIGIAAGVLILVSIRNFYLGRR